MKPEKNKNFVVSCDIGSTHITMMGAHVTEGINVLGSVRVPNQSVRAGQILSLEQLIESLHEATDELEHQTGLPIHSVRAILPVSEVFSSLTKDGITLRENEVHESDIERIIAQLRGQKPPINQEWLHMISTTYDLDGKRNIRDPRGLFGSNLSLLGHRIAGPAFELKALARALNRSGLKAESLSFQGVAAAQAAVSEEEKDIGCLVLHMGAYTTCITEFESGQSIYAGQIPFGSHHITKDLSIGLRTTVSEAERLKKSYGLGSADSENSQSQFPLFDSVALQDHPNDPVKSVYKKDLELIIESRLHEILSMIKKNLCSDRTKKINQTNKGIVLTGGGSQLIGLVPFVEKHFNQPVKMGRIPKHRGIAENYMDATSLPSLGLLSPNFGSVYSDPIYTNDLCPQPSLFARIKDNLQEIFSAK